MAIQMRRGAYAQFDPSKMKAGEWAVSTDSDTKKQQIWMCFAPGIVKRMGTVEDFDVEIQRLIQSYLDGMANPYHRLKNQRRLRQKKLPRQVILLHRLKNQRKLLHKKRTRLHKLQERLIRR